MQEGEPHENPAYGAAVSTGSELEKNPAYGAAINTWQELEESSYQHVARIGKEPSIWSLWYGTAIQEI